MSDQSAFVEVLAQLKAAGVTDADIEQAAADGSLFLLAVDKLALGQEIRYDLAEACQGTGLPEEELRHIWRSLGFPELRPDEIVFSDVDLANLRAVADLMHSGVVSPEVTYAMTRVIGSSIARVASAFVDAVSSAPATSLDAMADDIQSDALEPVISSEGFLPLFPEVLAQVWRRHLQAAARRRMLRGEEDGAGTVVGFADLVGFTALAQQVTDEELADVVDRFEHLAYDVVVSGGGRVVKMIGDEVMFLVHDPVAAAEIALGLADASRDAAELSDVRVGLAMGPVVEREGDAFGATVNLASRATAIAYPGSVVVSPELRAALADSDAYVFKGMRPRFLKNIGRVALAVLRRSGDGPTTMFEAFDERRRQMRDAMRDRLTGTADGDGDDGDGDDGSPPGTP